MGEEGKKKVLKKCDVLFARPLSKKCISLTLPEMGTSRRKVFFISGPKSSVTKCCSEIKPESTMTELPEIVGTVRLSHERTKLGSGSVNSETSNSAQFVTDPSCDSDIGCCEDRSIHGFVVAHARHLPSEAFGPSG